MLAKTDDCFRCHHCRELPPGGMDAKLIDVLNKMCVNAEQINSAYRCEEHNRFVGGEPNSFHCQGMAADVDAAGTGVWALAALAEAAGADGIGKYFESNFVHVDTRGEVARW